MTIPTMAAPTVWMLIASGRMIPLPMVAATAVPAKAPAALRTAAMKTACDGRSTRVETTVAIAFGASVQPLTNSAARIRASQGASGRSVEISGTAALSLRLGVLQHHVAEHMGELLALVAGVFQIVVDLLPLHGLERMKAVAAEEIGDHGQVQR